MFVMKKKLFFVVVFQWLCDLVVKEQCFATLLSLLL